MRDRATWAWAVAAMLLVGCSLDRSGVGLADAFVEVDAASEDGGAPDAFLDAELDAGLDGGSDAGMPDAGCPTDAPGVIAVSPAVAVTMDGDLTEWGDAAGIGITAPGDYVQTGEMPALDGADLSATFDLRWTPDTLYVAVAVTDDRHRGADVDSLLAERDSVTIAFDMASNGGTAYDRTDDFVLGFGLSSSFVVLRHRFVAPDAAGPSSDACAVVRRSPVTTYEIAVPATALGLPRFDPSTAFGLGLIVNEGDFTGSDREGFLEWPTGGGSGEPLRLGRIVLAAAECVTPP